MCLVKPSLWWQVRIRWLWWRSWFAWHVDLQLIVLHTCNSSSNSFKSMWFNSPERKNADANQTPSSSVDLVIGFGGNSTLPQEVTPAIVSSKQLWSTRSRIHGRLLFTPLDVTWNCLTQPLSWPSIRAWVHPLSESWTKRKKRRTLHYFSPHRWPSCGAQNRDP